MTAREQSRSVRVSTLVVALAPGLLGAAAACGAGNNGALDLFPPSATTSSAPDVGDARAERQGEADARAPREEPDARPAVSWTAPTGCTSQPVCSEAGCGSPVGCRSDLDCRSGGLARCDLASGNCVECLKASDCTSGDRPLCDTALHRCAECLTNADCHDPSKPGCLETTGRCEDCSSNAQCPAGQTCDTTQGQCR